MSWSQKQIEYFRDSTRSFNVSIGAVSSGKTYAQILRWIEYIYNEVPKGCLLLMSGKTGESLYDNVVRDMELFTAGDCRVYRQPLRVVVQSRGIEIACADAHNEKSWGRIQGKTVYGWLADEITQHPASFTRMAQARCRGDGKVWPKFWTGNPDIPSHYIKTDYIDNENLDLGHWQFGLQDNPVLTDEYKTELRSSYHGVYRARYIGGEWVLAEGAVYPGFDEGTHVVSRPVTAEKIRAIDFGFTNPFVCLWGCIDEDGRVHIYDEHYEAKKLIAYHAAKIDDRGPVRRSVGDHDAQDSAELRDKGIHIANARKDVSSGIQFVTARLALAGDGRPRLTIDPKCSNLRREMTGYRWTDAKDGVSPKEEPMKANDHAVDALRYLIMELDYSSKPHVSVPVAL